MNGKIRVLMVGPAPGMMGGISSVAAGYLASSLHTRVQLTYVASYVDGKAVKKGLLAIEALISLLIHTATDRPDIVHIHMATRGSFFRKAIYANIARLCGLTVVLHVHGAEFVKFYRRVPGWVRAWIRQVLRTVNTVIALSPQWAQALHGISPGAKIRVVANGVQVPNDTPRRGSFSYFLSLGRLGERKGTYDIVRALARLNDRSVRVILAGDGEISEVLRLARELGVENQVVAPGWVDGSDKEGLLSGASAFLLPSYDEGLPMALLEAMGFGLPVITTPVGGIPEAVKDRVSGMLVAPGDVRALADAMAMLARSTELRIALGAAAREEVITRFGVEGSVNDLLHVYETLVSE